MEIKLLEKNIFEGENNSRTLNITVEKAFAGYEIRLAFLTPLGCRCITPEIKISNCEAQYLLPFSLLDAPGRLFAQIVAENEEQHIIKSEVYAFDVEKSVDTDSNSDCDGEIITLSGVKKSVDKLFDELESYALKCDIPTVPENVSAFNNDAGYVAEKFVYDAIIEGVNVGVSDETLGLTIGLFSAGNRGEMQNG